jgi:hypothetical protein
LLTVLLTVIAVFPGDVAPGTALRINGPDGSIAALNVLTVNTTPSMVADGVTWNCTKLPTSAVTAVGEIVTVNVVATAWLPPQPAVANTAAPKDAAAGCPPFHPLLLRHPRGNFLSLAGIGRPQLKRGSR